MSKFSNDVLLTAAELVHDGLCESHPGQAKLISQLIHVSNGREAWDYCVFLIRYHDLAEVPEEILEVAQGLVR